MVRQRQSLKITTEKSVYFASDQHFGAPNEQDSLVREKHFVSWLNKIKDDCGVLFILGDLFDFWFEYNEVVPKGFVRVLGKLAEFTDKGIPVYFFVGNHDLWAKNYLNEELGLQIFREPTVFEINQKKLLIAHGDGLGHGDHGYKAMKKVFTNPIARFLFSLLHPDLAVWLGKTTSRKNKLISGEEDVKFAGEENEWLICYAKEELQKRHLDYFVFGHRHLPMTIDLTEKSQYINLGDWIHYFTYGKLTNETFSLERYPL